MHVKRRTDSRDGLRKRLQALSENSTNEEFNSLTEIKQNDCLIGLFVFCLCYADLAITIKPLQTEAALQ